MTIIRHQRNTKFLQCLSGIITIFPSSHELFIQPCYKWRYAVKVSSCKAEYSFKLSCFRSTHMESLSKAVCGLTCVHGSSGHAEKPGTCWSHSHKGSHFGGKNGIGTCQFPNTCLCSSSPCYKGGKKSVWFRCSLVKGCTKGTELCFNICYSFLLIKKIHLCPLGKTVIQAMVIYGPLQLCLKDCFFLPLNLQLPIDGLML